MATGTVVDVVMPQMGVSVVGGHGHALAEERRRHRRRPTRRCSKISTDKVDTEVPSPGTRRAAGDPRAGRRDRSCRDAARADRAGGPTPACSRRRRPRRSRPRSFRRARARSPSPPRRHRSRSLEPRARAERPAPEPAAAPGGNGASTERHTFVSPVVARIAAEHGIDPSTIEGTGRDGRVTKKDILAFVESGSQHRAAAESDRSVRHLLAQAAAAHRRAAPHRRRSAQPPPAAAGATAPLRRRAGRARARREPRADERHAPRHRRAHAPLARHRRARHERDRGRHVEGRRDPREAEERVQSRLRRQPHLPRVHRARDGRDASRLAVGERRAPRRLDPDAQLRQPRLRGRRSTAARG